MQKDQLKLLENKLVSVERVDNITDNALIKFREHYGEDSISKDDIFYYVYGILNSSVYKKRFSNDLSKELPRIPFVKTFEGFSRLRGGGGSCRNSTLATNLALNASYLYKETI